MSINQKSLLSWLVWTPLKFSVLALVLLFLFIFTLYMIYPDASNMLIALTTLVGIICAAACIYHKLPKKNMDQKSFIALTNLQMLVVSTAFIIAMLLINEYKDVIVMRFWLMNYQINASVLAIATLIAVFFLYLIGIFVTSLYAKYSRCREMGISAWKIILSMPFGFSLLWTPGYLLKDQNKSTPAVSIHSKWYSKITEKIINNQLYTVFSFIIMVVYSGFFYGFNASFITLASVLIFAIWFKISGLSSFRQQQKKLYSYTSIILNILVLIGIIGYSSLQHAPDVTVNISDIETVETTN